MRAHEFISEDYGVSISQPVTLRNLHKMKHKAARDKRLEQQRNLVQSAMYSDNAWKLEALEIARKTLELDQLRAEIEVTQAVKNTESKYALHANAKSGIEAEKDSDKKITKLAKRGLGRRKKHPTAT
jgi:hypothetical protein